MKKKPLNLISVVSLWLTYLVTYLFFKEKGLQQYSGILALIGQSGLDLLAFYYAWKLSQLATSETKVIFKLFALAFAFAFLADTTYNVIVNILQINNISDLLDSVFDIPFLCFLLFQLIAWVKIAPNLHDLKKNYTTLVLFAPILFIALIIAAIFIFAFQWKVNLYSLTGFYQIADTIVEIFSFIVVILCVAGGKNALIRLLAIGFLIIMASDFIIRTGVIENHITPNSILEATWVLGLSLMTYCLFELKEKKEFLEAKQWVYDINNLQFQCAFWAFAFCLSSLFIFLAINYLLSFDVEFVTRFNIEKLPSVLILFLIPAALISNFFTRKLLEPLKNIENTVDKFSKGMKYSAFLDSDIVEFQRFNAFIQGALQAMHDKKEAEEVLVKIATQTAHDIRSPLLVLNRVLKDLSFLPEKKRIDTRHAIQRVTDIANNLLIKYKKEKMSVATETTLSSEPAAMMLESIISEKRIEVTNTAIEIKLEISTEAYNVFVLVDVMGFKRVISNLVNNAIEALRNKDGLITVILSKHDGRVLIDIKDNGCGIPQDKLITALEEGATFGKKEGSGLGLPYAVSKISEWHGDYSLTSEPGEGTQFEIILPECKPAEWFRSEIAIEKNGAIVILDDDDYIHQIWDERFPEDFLQKHQLKIFHFNNPQSFIELCEGKTFTKTIFLLDYELGKYQETGLTLAKMLNIGQYATLVTSRYEDEDVRENCKKLAMKIIPKSFAELTPIRVFEPTEIIFIDDEEVIGEFWKDSAESAGKTISVFQDPRDFMRIVHLYPKDVLIYIDSSLGNGLKGEDFANQLYEMGYQNIFLATGFSKDHFKDVTWIKDVVGKEPPWG